jgi:hypothetical protein
MNGVMRLKTGGLNAKRLRLVICLVLVVSGAGAVQAGQLPTSAIPGPTGVSAQSAAPRRVNIPYFSGAVDEGQSAIFWFGKNEFSNVPGAQNQTPGLNYVDVRMAYSPNGLFWRANVIDY